MVTFWTKDRDELSPSDTKNNAHLEAQKAVIILCVVITVVHARCE